MTDLIPRLSSGEMPLELAEYLRPRVERLGYLGEFFQYTAHQPKALLSFMTFTEELRKALPEKLTETVALSVSNLMDNAYERVQHERLCVKLGFEKAWIREVNALSPSTASRMTNEERLVQTLVIAAVERFGVGLRRLRKSADFSHELQRSCLDLFVGCRRVEIKKSSDISTHECFTFPTGTIQPTCRMRLKIGPNHASRHQMFRMSATMISAASTETANAGFNSIRRIETIDSTAKKIGTTIHHRQVARNSVTPGPADAPIPCSKCSRTSPLRHAVDAE